jgi:hypothetical protein
MDLKTTEATRGKVLGRVRDKMDISYLDAGNLLDDVDALLVEVEEMQASADLRWGADMRAIKRWQEAHPGNERVWPDHADLCVWLMEQLEQK